MDDRAEIPAGGLGLVASSYGRIEIAANRASAADILGIERGEALRLIAD